MYSNKVLIEFDIAITIENKDAISLQMVRCTKIIYRVVLAILTVLVHQAILKYLYLLSSCFTFIENKGFKICT